jgi:hypothetical protein
VYYAESDRFEVCFGASTAGEGEAGEEQPVDDDFSHISVVKATTDGKIIAMRFAQASSFVRHASEGVILLTDRNEAYSSTE